MILGRPGRELSHQSGAQPPVPVARVDTDVIKSCGALGEREGTHCYDLTFHRGDIKMMGHVLNPGESIADSLAEGAREMPEEIADDEFANLQKFIGASEPSHSRGICRRVAEVHSHEERGGRESLVSEARH